jgi:hypothetical protein
LFGEGLIIAEVNDLGNAGLQSRQFAGRDHLFA